MTWQFSARAANAAEVYWTAAVRVDPGRRVAGGDRVGQRIGGQLGAQMISRREPAEVTLGTPIR